MAELYDLISKSSLETSRITACVQAAAEGETNQTSIAALIDTERELQLMRKQERAHFFSTKEQELILKLYEEERDILTAKSNTSSASKLREEAWQRIADKINSVSDSGYKRSWQQVKVKHKNIMQSARRRRAEMLKNGGIPAIPSLSSAEDDVLLQKDKLRVEVIPGPACIEPLSESDTCNAYINVSGHPVILLPVTKTEPESVSSDDTDISDTHYEGDVPNSSFQDMAAAPNATAGSEVQKEDLRSLYCTYLKKEIENREQLMAYRALKMKKLEKEILLLDKQLE